MSIEYNAYKNRLALYIIFALLRLHHNYTFAARGISIDQVAD